MALTPKIYQLRCLASLTKFFETARVDTLSNAFSAAVDRGLGNSYKPMPGLPSVPYVCLRIPTGGGKTVMGAHIIRVAARSFMDRSHPLVMWMVPTSQIKTQTLEAFRNPRHPYRQELDEAFGGKVAIFDVAEFTRIRPADLVNKVCLVISTVAALRVEETEGRKVYDYHEDLEPHFLVDNKQTISLEKTDDGTAKASFANLLRLHSPLVIMDEAHNATTQLSYEVYKRLGPSAVVELTATPDLSSSNILVSVSAFELKAEDMIKFPVVLKEHNGEWQVAVSSAVARRRALEKIAIAEPEYIRPILLIQAENSKGTATVAEVERHLMETDGLTRDAIAIATGDTRQIDGVDLFAKNCPVEVIITKQALKEGWDCSFAYVFCSVAQVRSDKDIQQLLGRVLRMPYASPRKQAEMSKAYAHVVTDSFGKAAGELTQSLISIGFNPMEAANAIRKEQTETLPLPLTGGQALAPKLPVTRIPVRKAPDLADIPERDKERVVFVPDVTGGKGGTVEITDELNLSTVEAIAATAVPSKRDDIFTQVERHQMATVAAKAPSERGTVFQVPRLCLMEQGELELIDRGMVASDFKWDPLASPPDLTSLRLKEESMTFEVYLEGQEVQYHHVKDDAATYLPGFAYDRTDAELIGWLDQEIRDPSIKQPILREWLRRAIQDLKDRGFSLSQLLKGQFILRRKLSEQLLLCKERAYKDGFQQVLFSQDTHVVTSDAPDYTFVYPADMTHYPANWYYHGPYRFRKHYYPIPGDLNWKTPKGTVTEEFGCAQVLDTLEEVDFWVRNLVHRTQFWMPTSVQRTYPDFVARLSDGRLLVVEYKGADRFTADQEKEKRLVGALWQKQSEGKGLYLMAQKSDEVGCDVREQILLVISR
jgi:type III restriction enzyme